MKSILLLIFIICSYSSYSQSGNRSENNTKVVKLKTCITPRRGNIVFVKKAIEVIIIPIDQYGNEIEKLKNGIDIFLFANDSIKENSEIGLRKIFGKTYIYLTPLRVHSGEEKDFLRVGAFLLDSITRQPDYSTGNFTLIAVVDHIPIPPDVSTFKIMDFRGQYISHNRIDIQKLTDKFIFFWDPAADSNETPLKKSSSTNQNDSSQWIKDQCQIRYTFKIAEMPEYSFQKEPLLQPNICISSKDFVVPYFTLRQGSAKFVPMNYFIICEDDIYKYNMAEYKGKLTTGKKVIQVIYDIMKVDKASSDNNLKSELFQNYPNPFNPSTVISYSVRTGRATSYIRLSVFDVIGKEITILEEGYKPDGYYEIEWNAKEMPSGLYYYKLIAGGNIEYRKMILVK